MLLFGRDRIQRRTFVYRERSRRPVVSKAAARHSDRPLYVLACFPTSTKPVPRRGGTGFSFVVPYTGGMNIETLAVHAGRRVDPATGAVTPPIHLSTTFERSETGDYPRGFTYSREANPNRNMLEECLAALEGGREALVLSSGLAVLTAVIQGLEPGDHILAPSDVYYGFNQVLNTVFAKWPIEASYVDMTDLDAVRAAVRSQTRLVWVETPSNPLMRVTDLAAIAEIARAANAISICDGTFTTPLLQRPLDLGIDMVAHSTTKYLGGHSDLVGGALITRYQNYQ